MINYRYMLYKKRHLLKCKWRFKNVTITKNYAIDPPIRKTAASATIA
jgi:hypothetical protein